MNRGIFLTRRSGKNCDSSIEQIIPGHLQAGGTAPEHAWEQLGKTSIDLIEGVLEALSGFLVDFSNRRL